LSVFIKYSYDIILSQSILTLSYLKGTTILKYIKKTLNRGFISSITIEPLQYYKYS